MLLATIHIGLGNPDKAVLTESVSLQIKKSNGGSGSLTLPAGREVNVVAKTTTKSKISVPNFAEGWVENNKIKVIETKNPVGSVESPDVNQPTTNTALPQESESLNPAPSNAKVTIDPSTLTIAIAEQESETKIDFKGSKCRGNRVTKTYTPLIKGLPSEGKEFDNIVDVKLYTIVSNSEGGKPLVIPFKGKPTPSSRLNKAFFPELEAVELKKQKDGTFKASYDDLQCSPCRNRKEQYIEGYYAELYVGDKVVQTTHSDLTRKELKVVKDYIGPSDSEKTP